MQTVRCVLPIAAELGEGPVWADGALWFVDIDRKQIHRCDPERGTTQSWNAPGKVSFVLPRRGGGFVVGLPGRLARFSPAPGTFEEIVALETAWPDNRTNDACVDGAGRLWFGTMDDRETAASGVLYCWDGTGAPVSRDEGYVISNGPAFSPDRRTFYHTDTQRRTIHRFDVADDGSLSNKRGFIVIDGKDGWPDGTTVDSQGCLWIALYGGKAVRRYAPDGELLACVPMPCEQVTKVTFGGPDLKTAYVTTARRKLDAGALAKQPLAGALFAFEAPAAGLAQTAIAF